MTILMACGMATEAAIWNNAEGSVTVQGADNDVLLPEQLDAAIAAGVITGLMSFGVSGALETYTKAGDVVVAVAAYKDPTDIFFADGAWSRRLVANLAGHVRFSLDRFGYSSRVVATAEAKTALRKTGAGAVDMETWVVAQAARRHGLPWVAVRAISDTSTEDLPPAALAAMTPSGHIDLGAVIQSISVDPAQLPALLRLQSNSYSAFDALASARMYMSVDFSFPTAR